MPRFSRTVYDEKGNAIGVACGRSPDHKCSSCGAFGATIQCDHPVKNKTGYCDRWLCRACAVHVGPDKDYCPPHNRLAQPGFA